MNECEPLYRVIGLAMAVHRELGPDHAEIAYHRAMLAAFRQGLDRLNPAAQGNALNGDGLIVSDRPTLALKRDGKLLAEYLPDCIVSCGSLTLILEYKAELRLREISLRQVRAYLTAYEKPAAGLLLNFGGPSLTWRQVRTRRSSIPPKWA